MDYLKLENQLCFPLYAFSRHITSIYRPHLEKIGLTYPQFLVMMVLWEQNKVTVKKLCDLLWLDSGTLTPLLKRMEKNGLLSRKRSVLDERLVDIIITQEGILLKEQAKDIPLKVKDAINIADEQMGQLLQQLKQLMASVKCNFNL